jgi:hypothetical protein
MREITESYLNERPTLLLTHDRQSRVPAGQRRARQHGVFAPLLATDSGIGKCGARKSLRKFSRKEHGGRLSKSRKKMVESITHTRAARGIGCEVEVKLPACGDDKSIGKGKEIFNRESDTYWVMLQISSFLV